MFEVIACLSSKLTCSSRGFFFIRFVGDFVLIFYMDIQSTCLLMMCHLAVPCLRIDSFIRLMTVWRKTGKIIRTAIFDTYAQL